MKNQTVETAVVVPKKIAPAQEFIAELSGRLIEMVESGSKKILPRAQMAAICAPFNPVSKHFFQGGNRIMLAIRNLARAQEGKPIDPRFCTFDQVSSFAQQTKQSVRISAGEKAIKLLKPTMCKGRANGDDELSLEDLASGVESKRGGVLYMSAYPIFAMTQMTGVKPFVVSEKAVNEADVSIARLNLTNEAGFAEAANAAGLTTGAVDWFRVNVFEVVRTGQCEPDNNGYVAEMKRAIAHEETGLLAKKLIQAQSVRAFAALDGLKLKQRIAEVDTTRVITIDELKVSIVANVTELDVRAAKQAALNVLKAEGVSLADAYEAEFKNLNGGVVDVGALNAWSKASSAAALSLRDAGASPVDLRSMQFVPVDARAIELKASSKSIQAPAPAPVVEEEELESEMPEM